MSVQPVTGCPGFLFQALGLMTNLEKAFLVKLTWKKLLNPLIMIFKVNEVPNPTIKNFFFLLTIPLPHIKDK